MISNWDQCGASPCARSEHPAFGVLAVSGSDTPAYARQRWTKPLGLAYGQLRVTAAAPQTTMNGIVRPSAALHERSP
jgi:hypothetical protein